MGSNTEEAKKRVVPRTAAPPVHPVGEQKIP